VSRELETCTSKTRSKPRSRSQASSPGKKQGPEEAASSPSPHERRTPNESGAKRSLPEGDERREWASSPEEVGGSAEEDVSSEEVSALIENLGDSEKFVHKAAMERLVRIGGPAVINLLIMALAGHNNDNVRARAAVLLGDLKAKEAVSALEARVQSGAKYDEFVARAALQALCKIIAASDSETVATEGTDGNGKTPASSPTTVEQFETDCLSLSHLELGGEKGYRIICNFKAVEQGKFHGFAQNTFTGINDSMLFGRVVPPQADDKVVVIEIDSQGIRSREERMSYRLEKGSEMYRRALQYIAGPRGLNVRRVSVILLPQLFVVRLSDGAVKEKALPICAWEAQTGKLYSIDLEENLPCFLEARSRSEIPQEPGVTEIIVNADVMQMIFRSIAQLGIACVCQHLHKSSFLPGPWLGANFETRLKNPHSLFERASSPNTDVAYIINAHSSISPDSDLVNALHGLLQRFTKLFAGNLLNPELHDLVSDIEQLEGRMGLRNPKDEFSISWLDQQFQVYPYAQSYPSLGLIVPFEIAHSEIEKLVAQSLKDFSDSLIAIRIDGKTCSGKTTLAQRLKESTLAAIPSEAIVRVDVQIREAWNEGPIENLDVWTAQNKVKLAIIDGVHQPKRVVSSEGETFKDIWAFTEVSDQKRYPRILGKYARQIRGEEHFFGPDEIKMPPLLEALFQINIFKNLRVKNIFDRYWQVDPSRAKAKVVVRTSNDYGYAPQVSSSANTKNDDLDIAERVSVPAESHHILANRGLPAIIIDESDIDREIVLLFESMELLAVCRLVSQDWIKVLRRASVNVLIDMNITSKLKMAGKLLLVACIQVREDLEKNEILVQQMRQSQMNDFLSQPHVGLGEIFEYANNLVYVAEFAGPAQWSRIADHKPALLDNRGVYQFEQFRLERFRVGEINNVTDSLEFFRRQRVTQNFSQARDPLFRYSPLFKARSGDFLVIHFPLSDKHWGIFGHALISLEGKSIRVISYQLKKTIYYLNQFLGGFDSRNIAIVSFDGRFNRRFTSIIEEGGLGEVRTYLLAIEQFPVTTGVSPRGVLLSHHEGQIAGGYRHRWRIWLSKLFTDGDVSKLPQVQIASFNCGNSLAFSFCGTYFSPAESLHAVFPQGLCQRTTSGMVKVPPHHGPRISPHKGPKTLSPQAIVSRVLGEEDQRAGSVSSPGRSQAMPQEDGKILVGLWESKDRPDLCAVIAGVKPASFIRAELESLGCSTEGEMEESLTRIQVATNLGVMSSYYSSGHPALLVYNKKTFGKFVAMNQRVFLRLGISVKSGPTEEVVADIFDQHFAHIDNMQKKAGCAPKIARYMHMFTGFVFGYPLKDVRGLAYVEEDSRGSVSWSGFSWDIYGAAEPSQRVAQIYEQAYRSVEEAAERGADIAEVIEQSSHNNPSIEHLRGDLELIPDDFVSSSGVRSTPPVIDPDIDKLRCPKISKGQTVHIWQVISEVRSVLSAVDRLHTFLTKQVGENRQRVDHTAVYDMRKEKLYRDFLNKALADKKIILFLVGRWAEYCTLKAFIEALRFLFRNRQTIGLINIIVIKEAVEAKRSWNLPIVEKYLKKLEVLQDTNVIAYSNGQQIFYNRPHPDQDFQVVAHFYDKVGDFEAACKSEVSSPGAKQGPGQTEYILFTKNNRLQRDEGWPQSVAEGTLLLQPEYNIGFRNKAPPKRNSKVASLTLASSSLSQTSNFKQQTTLSRASSSGAEDTADNSSAPSLDELNRKKHLKAIRQKIYREHDKGKLLNWDFRPEDLDELIAKGWVRFTYPSEAWVFEITLINDGCAVEFYQYRRMPFHIRSSQFTTTLTRSIVPVEEAADDGNATSSPGNGSADIGSIMYAVHPDRLEITPAGRAMTTISVNDSPKEICDKLNRVFAGKNFQASCLSGNDIELRYKDRHEVVTDARLPFRLQRGLDDLFESEPSSRDTSSPSADAESVSSPSKAEVLRKAIQEERIKEHLLSIKEDGITAGGFVGDKFSPKFQGIGSRDSLTSDRIATVIVNPVFINEGGVFEYLESQEESVGIECFVGSSLRNLLVLHMPTNKPKKNLQDYWLKQILYHKDIGLLCIAAERGSDSNVLEELAARKLQSVVFLIKVEDVEDQIVKGRDPVWQIGEVDLSGPVAQDKFIYILTPAHLVDTVRGIGFQGEVIAVPTIREENVEALRTFTSDKGVPDYEAAFREIIERENVPFFAHITRLLTLEEVNHLVIWWCQEGKIKDFRLAPLMVDILGNEDCWGANNTMCGGIFIARVLKEIVDSSLREPLIEIFERPYKGERLRQSAARHNASRQRQDELVAQIEIDTKTEIAKVLAQIDDPRARAYSKLYAASSPDAEKQVKQLIDQKLATADLIDKSCLISQDHVTTVAKLMAAGKDFNFRYLPASVIDQIKYPSGRIDIILVDGNSVSSPGRMANSQWLIANSNPGHKPLAISHMPSGASSPGTNNQSYRVGRTGQASSADPQSTPDNGPGRNSSPNTDPENLSVPGSEKRSAEGGGWVSLSEGGQDTYDLSSYSPYPQDPFIFIVHAYQMNDPECSTKEPIERIISQVGEDSVLQVVRDPETDERFFYASPFIESKVPVYLEDMACESAENAKRLDDAIMSNEGIGVVGGASNYCHSDWNQKILLRRISAGKRTAMHFPRNAIYGDRNFLKWARMAEGPGDYEKIAGEYIGVLVHPYNFSYFEGVTEKKQQIPSAVFENGRLCWANSEKPVVIANIWDVMPGGASSPDADLANDGQGRGGESFPELSLLQDHIRSLFRGQIDTIIRSVRSQKVIAAKEKQEGDSATEADITIGRLLVRELSLLVLGSVVLEEEGFSAEHLIAARKTRFVWVVDPIDGTKAFRTKNNCEYCVAVCLFDWGRPVLSLIYAPEFELQGNKGCLFEARDDLVGAYLNERRMYFNQSTDFNRGLCTNHTHTDENRNGIERALVQLFGRELQIRAYAGHSTLLRYCMCASQDYPGPQVFTRRDASIWDVVQAAYIVEKSGGLVMYPDGESIFPVDFGRLIVSNEKISIPFNIACSLPAREKILDSAAGVSSAGEAREVVLSFGTSEISLKIPGSNISRIISARELPVLEDAALAIEKALNNPVDSGKLEDLSKAKKVAVLVEDSARPQPRRQLLKGVTLRLKGAQAISFIITTGAHDPRHPDNRGIMDLIEEVCAENGIASFRILANDAGKDSRGSDYVYIGATSRETPFYVLREVADADMHVIISGISLHNFAGYSNFTKHYLPGVAGFASIEKNHTLAFHESSRPGYHPLHPQTSRRSNAAAEDMREAYDLLMRFGGAYRRVPFSVFALGFVAAKNKLIWAASGDPLEVSRRGFSVIDDYLTYREDQYDYVIMSCGGFPYDRNLYSAHRSLEMNGAIFAKNLLWLAQCNEGIAPHEGAGKISAEEQGFDLETLFSLSGDMDKAIQRLEAKNAFYLYKGYKFLKLLSRLKKNAGNIFLYSRLSDEAARGAGIIPVVNPQEVIDNWLKQTPEAQILAIEGGNRTCAITGKGSFDSDRVSSPAVGEHLYNFGLRLLHWWRLAKLLIKDYYAALFDIDGTLRERGGAVPDEIIAWFVRQLDQGRHIGLVSNRSESNIEEGVVRRIREKTKNLGTLWVFPEAGAYVYNVLAKDSLPEERKDEANHMIVTEQQMQRRQLLWEESERLNIPALLTEQYLAKDHPGCSFFLNPEKRYQVGFEISQPTGYKMSETAASEILREAQKNIRGFFSEATPEVHAAIDRFFEVKASTISVSFQMKGVHKGGALRHFAQMLGVEPRRIAKIGDAGQPGGNDFELLREKNSFNVGPLERVDLRNAHQVSIILAMGLSGPEATAWLLAKNWRGRDRLNIVALPAKRANRCNSSSPLEPTGFKLSPGHMNHDLRAPDHKKRASSPDGKKEVDFYFSPYSKSFLEQGIQGEFPKLPKKRLQRIINASVIVVTTPAFDSMRPFWGSGFILSADDNYYYCAMAAHIIDSAYLPEVVVIFAATGQAVEGRLIRIDVKAAAKEAISYWQRNGLASSPGEVKKTETSSFSDVYEQDRIFKRVIEHLIRQLQIAGRTGRLWLFPTNYDCAHLYRYYSSPMAATEQGLIVTMRRRIRWLSSFINSIRRAKKYARDKKQWFSQLAGILTECYEAINATPIEEVEPVEGVENYRFNFELPVRLKDKNLLALPALKECLDPVIDRAGLRCGSRCIEIGSGMGVLRDILLSELELDMTDFNPYFCALNAARHPNSRISVREAWDLRCESGTYDAVFELRVLDIAARLPDIINEARRVLKENGFFIHLMDVPVVAKAVVDILNDWSRDLLEMDVARCIPNQYVENANLEYIGPTAEEIEERKAREREDNYNWQRLDLLDKFRQNLFDNKNRLFEAFLEIEFSHRGFEIEFHQKLPPQDGLCYIYRNTHPFLAWWPFKPRMQIKAWVSMYVMIARKNGAVLASSPSPRERSFAEKTDSASWALEEIERTMYTALRRYANVGRSSGQNSWVTGACYEEAHNLVLDYFDIPRNQHQDYVSIFNSVDGIGKLERHFQPYKPSFCRTLFSNDYGLSFGVGAIVIDRVSLAEDKDVPPPIAGGGAVTGDRFGVRRKKVRWAPAPHKFEAGTPNIIGAIAFAKALSLVKQTKNPDLFKDRPRDRSLAELFQDDLAEYEGLELLNRLRERVIGRGEMVPTVEGEKPYIHLDNAASTLISRPTLEAGIRALRLSAEDEAAAIAQVEVITKDFLGAGQDCDVVFTQNTTEAINLAAENLGQRVGDGYYGYIEPVVATTVIEHNSNELPWRFIPGVELIRLSQASYESYPWDIGVLEAGRLGELLWEYNQVHKHGNKRIVLITMTAASNVSGHISSYIQRITDTVKKRKAYWYDDQHAPEVLVDAAQLAPHRPINMAEWGGDYLAFSAHKIYTPLGSGALIAKEGLLNPCIANRQLKKPNIVGIVALGKTMLLLNKIGMEVVVKEEIDLITYTLNKLAELPERVKEYAPLTLFVTDTISDWDLNRLSGIMSFNVRKKNPGDIAEFLAHHKAIGVRWGCFCAHIYVRITLIKEHDLSYQGMLRISLGLWNNEQDIDAFIDALEEAITADPLDVQHVDIQAMTSKAIDELYSLGPGQQTSSLEEKGSFDNSQSSSPSPHERRTPNDPSGILRAGERREGASPSPSHRASSSAKKKSEDITPHSMYIRYLLFGKDDSGKPGVNEELKGQLKNIPTKGLIGWVQIAFRDIDKQCVELYKDKALIKRKDAKWQIVHDRSLARKHVLDMAIEEAGRRHTNLRVRKGVDADPIFLSKVEERCRLFIEEVKAEFEKTRSPPSFLSKTVKIPRRIKPVVEPKNSMPNGLEGSWEQLRKQLRAKEIDVRSVDKAFRLKPKSKTNLCGVRNGYLLALRRSEDNQLHVFGLKDATIEVKTHGSILPMLAKVKDSRGLLSVDSKEGSVNIYNQSIFTRDSKGQGRLYQLEETEDGFRLKKLKVVGRDYLKLDPSEPIGVTDTGVFAISVKLPDKTKQNIRITQKGEFISFAEDKCPPAAETAPRVETITQHDRYRIAAIGRKLQAVTLCVSDVRRIRWLEARREIEKFIPIEGAGKELVRILGKLLVNSDLEQEGEEDTCLEIIEDLERIGHLDGVRHLDNFSSKIGTGDAKLCGAVNRALSSLYGDFSGRQFLAHSTAEDKESLAKKVGVDIEKVPRIELLLDVLLTEDEAEVLRSKVEGLDIFDIEKNRPAVKNRVPVLYRRALMAIRTALSYEEGGCPVSPRSGRENGHLLVFSRSLVGDIFGSDKQAAAQFLQELTDFAETKPKRVYGSWHREPPFIPVKLVKEFAVKVKNNEITLPPKVKRPLLKAKVAPIPAPRKRTKGHEGDTSKEIYRKLYGFKRYQRYRRFYKIVGPKHSSDRLLTGTSEFRSDEAFGLQEDRLKEGDRWRIRSSNATASSPSPHERRTPNDERREGASSPGDLAISCQLSAVSSVAVSSARERTTNYEQRTTFPRASSPGAEREQEILEKLELAIVAFRQAHEFFEDFIRRKGRSHFTIGPAALMAGINGIVTYLGELVEKAKAKELTLSQVAQSIKRIRTVDCVEVIFMASLTRRFTFPGLGHRERKSLLGDHGALRTGVIYVNEFLEEVSDLEGHKESEDHNGGNDQTSSPTPADNDAVEPRGGHAALRGANSPNRGNSDQCAPPGCTQIDIFSDEKELSELPFNPYRFFKVMLRSGTYTQLSYPEASDSFAEPIEEGRVGTMGTEPDQEELRTILFDDQNCTSLVVCDTETKETWYGHSDYMKISNLQKHFLLAEKRFAGRGERIVVCVAGGSIVRDPFDRDNVLCENIEETPIGTKEARGQLIFLAHKAGFKVITAIPEFTQVTVNMVFDPQEALLFIMEMRAEGASHEKVVQYNKNLSRITKAAVEKPQDQVNPSSPGKVFLDPAATYVFEMHNSPKHGSYIQDLYQKGLRTATERMIVSEADVAKAKKLSAFEPVISDDGVLPDSEFDSLPDVHSAQHIHMIWSGKYYLPCGCLWRALRSSVSWQRRLFRGQIVSYHFLCDKIIVGGSDILSLNLRGRAREDLLREMAGFVDSDDPLIRDNALEVFFNGEKVYPYVEPAGEVRCRLYYWEMTDKFIDGITQDQSEAEQLAGQEVVRFKRGRSRASSPGESSHTSPAEGKEEDVPVTRVTRDDVKDNNQVRRPPNEMEDVDREGVAKQVDVPTVQGKEAKEIEAKPATQPSPASSPGPNFSEGVKETLAFLARTYAGDYLRTKSTLRRFFEHDKRIIFGARMLNLGYQPLILKETGSGFIMVDNIHVQFKCLLGPKELLDAYFTVEVGAERCHMLVIRGEAGDRHFLASVHFSALADNYEDITRIIEALFSDSAPICGGLEGIQAALADSGLDKIQVILLEGYGLTDSGGMSFVEFVERFRSLEREGRIRFYHFPLHVAPNGEPIPARVGAKTDAVFHLRGIARKTNRYTVPYVDTWKELFPPLEQKELSINSSPADNDASSPQADLDSLIAATKPKHQPSPEKRMQAVRDLITYGREHGEAAERIIEALEAFIETDNRGCITILMQEVADYFDSIGHRSLRLNQLIISSKQAQRAYEELLRQNYSQPGCARAWKSLKKRLRFSLASLLIAITVIAGGVWIATGITEQEQWINRAPTVKVYYKGLKAAATEQFEKDHPQLKLESIQVSEVPGHSKDQVGKAIAIIRVAGEEDEVSSYYYDWDCKLSLGEVIRRTEDANPVDREVAVRALRIAGAREERAVLALIEALADEYSTVREVAAKALGEIKDPRAVEPLVEAAAAKDEHSTDVRQAIEDALVAIGGPAVPAMIGELRKEKSTAKPIMIGALVRIDVDDQRARLAVIGAVTDSDSFVRKKAVEALGQIDLSLEGAKVLTQALGDDDSGVRGAAAQVLGEKKVKSAVPALGKALKDGPVFAAAAEALTNIGNSEAAQVLSQHLGNNRKTNLILAEALVKLGHQAGPAVAGRLGDKQPEVRWITAQTSGRIKYHKAVPALIRLLKDRYSLVRRAAANALRQIKDPEAIPALRQALKEEKDPEVLRAVHEALLRLAEGSADNDASSPSRRRRDPAETKSQAGGAEGTSSSAKGDIVYITPDWHGKIFTLGNGQTIKNCDDQTKSEPLKKDSVSTSRVYRCRMPQLLSDPFYYVRTNGSLLLKAALPNDVIVATGANVCTNLAVCSFYPQVSSKLLGLSHQANPTSQRIETVVIDDNSEPFINQSTLLEDLKQIDEEMLLIVDFGVSINLDTQEAERVEVDKETATEQIEELLNHIRRKMVARGYRILFILRSVKVHSNLTVSLGGIGINHRRIGDIPADSQFFRDTVEVGFTWKTILHHLEACTKNGSFAQLDLHPHQWEGFDIEGAKVRMKLKVSSPIDNDASDGVSSPGASSPE